MDNKFTLKYIALEPLFHLISDLMSEGVEYIDLEGYIDPQQIQDMLIISRSRKEDAPEELLPDPPPSSSDKMTEDDINELI